MENFDIDTFHWSDKTLVLFCAFIDMSKNVVTSHHLNLHAIACSVPRIYTYAISKILSHDNNKPLSKRYTKNIAT